MSLRVVNTTYLESHSPFVQRRMTRVAPAEMMSLMNDADVRRHLPLANGYFGNDQHHQLVLAKEQIWETYGYGPWAYFLDSAFVGWGGLQPDGTDVDVALVLHRKVWGTGVVLFRHLLREAFDTVGVSSVTTLLPTSRTRVAALHRLGFRNDGTTEISGVPFCRFRLDRQHARMRFTP